MLTPRITPLIKSDDETTAALDKTPVSSSGEPYNLFTTLARHPRLLARINAMGGIFMTKGELTGRDREIVVLRVSTRTRCYYEWGHHVPLARKAGVTEKELRCLARQNDAVAWNRHDTVLLSVADRLLDAGEVDDALWGRACDEWSESQILELLTLIGFYRMIADLLKTVRVELDPGLPYWPATNVPCSTVLADISPLREDESATGSPMTCP